MSFTETVNYDDAGDFTFDSGKIDVPSGGPAALELVTTTENESEDFADDTGFTYDNSKAEFTGGQVQQTTQVSADTTFLANWGTDENADFVINGGSTTGTLVGNAVWDSGDGGRIDNTNLGTSYVHYDAAASDIDPGQVGCVRIIYKPDYSGNPGSHQRLFTFGDPSGSTDNSLMVDHIRNGSLRMWIRDQNNVNVTAAGAAWSPVAGTAYELELNWDLNTGSHRLFLDGVLHVSDTGTATRDTSTYIRFGQNYTPAATNAGRHYFLGAQVFNAVQHTANYTPVGIESGTSNFTASNVDLPAFTPSTGTYQTLTAFSANATNSPQYTISTDGGTTHQYWTGSAWATADGTFAQSNTGFDMNANIATVSGIVGSSSIVVRVLFDTGSSQMSITNLTLDGTAEAYAQDDPPITWNTGVLTDGLTSFSSTQSATGSDSVTWIVVVDSVDKYWTGAAWANSDGTLAQSNSAADVNTNAGSLDISNGSTVKMKAILHSDDGSSTPTLTQAVLGYSFYGGDKTAPDTCVVYGYLCDVDGTAKDGKTVTAKPAEPFFIGTGLIDKNCTATTTTNSGGYWELTLVQSILGTPSANFRFSIDGIKFDRAVPASSSAEFSTLSEV